MLPQYAQQKKEKKEKRNPKYLDLTLKRKVSAQITGSQQYWLGCPQELQG